MTGKKTVGVREKADLTLLGSVGAPMAGTIIEVQVSLCPAQCFPKDRSSDKFVVILLYPPSWLENLWKLSFTY